MTKSDAASLHDYPASSWPLEGLRGIVLLEEKYGRRKDPAMGNAAPPLSSLSAFIWPVPKQEFFDSYLYEQPLLSRGPRSLEDLDPLFAGFDVAKLIRASDEANPVQGWFGGVQFQKQLSREEAISLWRAGVAFTLYFHFAADSDQRGWMNEVLGRELGIPIGQCSMFASRGGPTSKTAWHWDKNENFTLQLGGTKRWRVAKGAAHVSTNSRFIAGGFGVEPEGRLVYRPNVTVAEIEREAVTFDVQPGDILYVPNGFWHEVEVVGDAPAVSLNLNFHDVGTGKILNAVEERLKALRKWRQRAPLRDARDIEALRARAGELIGGIAKDLETLRRDHVVPLCLHWYFGAELDVAAAAGEIAMVPLHRTSRFTRNPVATLALASEETSASEARAEVCMTHLGTFRFTAPSALRPALSWLSERRDAFLASDVPPAGLDDDARSDLLRVVLGSGYVALAD